MRLFAALLLLPCISAFIPSHHVTVPCDRPKCANCEQEVNIVLLPGYGVPSENYRPIAESLRTQLADKRVNANVHINRYSHDALSHFEAEARVKELLALHKGVVLVGHSQGAYLGAQIALRHKLPLIQWCGSSYDDSFASKMEDIPLMTIVCENDTSHPCLKAIANTYDTHSQNQANPSKLMVTVQDADHLYGVSSSASTHKDADVIASDMAAFVAYNLFKDEPSKIVLAMRMQATNDRFKHYLRERRHVYLSHFVERCQQEVYQNATFHNVHHSSYSSPVTTLFEIVWPWVSVPLDICVYLPSFVFSHPTHGATQSYNGETHSYISTKKYGVLGSLMFRNSEEPCLFAKLKHDGSATTAKDLNMKTFWTAYTMVSDEDRAKYQEKGKKMVFADDFEVPHIPFCSVIWLLTPLEKADTGKELKVRSPIIRTKAGPGKYDGRLNAKLLTIPQALQWILVKSFL
ncbi:hypothetical protein JKP88DRAFT_241035 [Tribonema minus]|uniref:AB hydrolase-1 domain-containing protein n=1 Tax=Tribonema minus TaxID=303371 RepID=A0A835Z679_9STRA|nr:hypothetical protein JKP88DRAFT_241035 [Tribonema minus]